MGWLKTFFWESKSGFEKHLEQLKEIEEIPNNWKWHKPRLKKIEEVDENLIEDLGDEYDKDLGDEYDKEKTLLNQLKNEIVELEKEIKERNSISSKEEERKAVKTNHLLRKIKELFQKKNYHLKKSDDINDAFNRDGIEDQPKRNLDNLHPAVKSELYDVLLKVFEEKLNEVYSNQNDIEFIQKPEDTSPIEYYGEKIIRCANADDISFSRLPPIDFKSSERNFNATFHLLRLDSNRRNLRTPLRFFVWLLIKVPENPNNTKEESIVHVYSSFEALSNELRYVFVKGKEEGHYKKIEDLISSAKSALEQGFKNLETNEDKKKTCREKLVQYNLFEK